MLYPYLDLATGYENLPNPLSQEEFDKYYNNMKLGDKMAKKKIIEHNMRLVLHIAHKFENTQTEMEELVSVGTIGLIKALDSFDIHKNILFVTYASRCIENEILMLIKKNKKYVNNISMNQVVHIDCIGDELKYEDLLEDENANYMQQYENREIYKVIRRIVNSLDEKNRLIVRLRFGFETSGRVYSQKEVAFILGVSQSCISRLEKKVLKQLKQEMQNLGIIEFSFEKAHKKRKSKLQSIYEYLCNYSKEEVDIVISMLSSEEKELMRFRYGENLENPISSPNWSIEKNYQFYGVLIPKMKKILKDLKTSHDEQLKKDLKLIKNNGI